MQYEPPNGEFNGCIEEVSRQVRLDTIYVKQFITNEMLQEIAKQTNQYSVQKLGTSVKTTPKEIEQVLGMYMNMGLVQMPNVQVYWEMETRYPPSL